MYRLKQLTLLGGDLILLYIGLYISVLLRYFEFNRAVKEFVHLFFPLTYLYLLGIIILFIIGLYDITRFKSKWAIIQKIILSATIWFSFGIFYFYLSPKVSITPKTILILNTISGFSLIMIWHYCYNKFLSSTIWQVSIVFAGKTPETTELINFLKQEPALGYKVLGIIETTTSINFEQSIPIASRLTDLLDQTEVRKTPQIIVIAPHFASNNEFLKELYTHLFQQIQTVELAKFYEDIFGRIPPFTFSESWFLINLHEQQKKMYDRVRIIFDYLLALILGIGFFITFPFIAIAIKASSPGPILFRQERVGRQEKKFILYKYRTMKVLGSDGSAEMHGPEFAKKDDPRITRVGKFLRRTRLDELPQFINILKNQMGIIGPRPERPEFVKQLTEKLPFYSLRHLIKPGLTGWAQLRNAYYGSIEENLRKLEFDLYYIKNRGPLIDIAITLKTINVVMRMLGR